VSETVDSLILDLLEWIGPGERPYVETMGAWRTSCPRLPVWEDATDRGFIERRKEPGRPAVVSRSARGTEHLQKSRRPVNDSTTNGRLAS
jgi:D-3-phosphoglycerate dehydrogenase